MRMRERKSESTSENMLRKHLSLLDPGKKIFLNSHWGSYKSIQFLNASDI